MEPRFIALAMKGMGMGDLEDLAAAARAKEKRTPAPIDVPISRSPSWIRRYMRRSGSRSFIFQCVIAGWSALFVFLWATMLLSSASGPRYYLNPQENNEAVGEAAAGGSCCLFGGWLLVALPCGIAAIATYEANNLS